MKTFKFALVLAIFLMLCISNVYAYNFGTNITMNDGRSGTWNNNDGSAYEGAGWWTRTTEDQEVEPGMVPNQVWDLEGFFQNGNKLSMIGGFNFRSGVPGYSQYTSGDIFINSDSDALYEYAIRVTWTNNVSGTYGVYSLDGSSSLVPVRESYNAPQSNPWRSTGGASITSGSFAYESGLNDSAIAATGLIGGNHYAVEDIDLSSFLTGGTDFTAHFTMGCGNDNLMGHSTAVPEPATLLLLGLGLIGLGVSSRKLRK